METRHSDRLFVTRNITPEPVATRLMEYASIIPIPMTIAMLVRNFDLRRTWFVRFVLSVASIQRQAPDPQKLEGIKHAHRQPLCFV